MVVVVHHWVGGLLVGILTVDGRGLLGRIMRGVAVVGGPKVDVAMGEAAVIAIFTRA